MAEAVAVHPLEARTVPLWQPYVILIIGVAAVSTGSLFVRLAQNAGAPSLIIAAVRMSLASLLIAPVALRRHRADLARLRGRTLALTLLSGMLLGIHFATWISSLEYTSVVTSVVLVTTNPLWVALAAPFILKERLSVWTLIAVLLGIGGSIIVSIGGDAGTAPVRNQPMFGNVLALTGAFAVAGYFLLGRQLRATLPTAMYVFVTYSTAALVLIALSILGGKSVLGLQPAAYLWMTLLALIPQLIGHTSYNYALGFLSAAYVSLTVLGEPIGSAILAALFLSEVPFPLQLVGGLFIAGALILSTREEVRKVRSR